MWIAFHLLCDLIFIFVFLEESQFSLAVADDSTPKESTLHHTLTNGVHDLAFRNGETCKA